ARPNWMGAEGGRRLYGGKAAPSRGRVRVGFRSCCRRRRRGGRPNNAFTGTSQTRTRVGQREIRLTRTASRRVLTVTRTQGRLEQIELFDFPKIERRD